MHIPVRVETYRAFARQEVDFACRRCGHRARAEIVGRGAAGSARGPAAAREDAIRDVARTIARARCPKCNERPPGALPKFLARYLALAAALVAVGFVIPPIHLRLEPDLSPHDQNIVAWLWPIVFASMTVLALPLPVWFEWRGTDRRVHWLGD